ncbi:MAG: hypothetical protein ABW092_21200 [Candidatus Thiodiazotropha sp.]
MTDAHIPYTDVDRDEWCEYMKAYRSQSNNAFLLCVDELLIERGLNRNSSISLIASSCRHAIMAANILTVAGYTNVAIEVGRKNASVFGPAAIGDHCEYTRGRRASQQWAKSFNRQMGQRLH